MQFRRRDPVALDPAAFRNRPGAALEAVSGDDTVVGSVAARVEGTVAVIFERWVAGGTEVLEPLVLELMRLLQDEFGIHELRAGANAHGLYEFYTRRIGMKPWHEIVRYELHTLPREPGRKSEAALRAFQNGDQPAVARLAGDDQSTDRLMRLAQEQQSRFVVAEMAGQVVGYGLSYVQGNGCLLKSLVVDPAWRGRGVGWDLAADAIRWSGALGLPIHLNTEVENLPACRLYESIGFHEAERVRIVHKSLIR